MSPLDLLVLLLVWNGLTVVVLCAEFDPRLHHSFPGWAPWRLALLWAPVALLEFALFLIRVAAWALRRALRWVRP